MHGETVKKKKRIFHLLSHTRMLNELHGPLLLGAFTKFRKAAINLFISACLSVCMDKLRSC